ncbi:MAG: hypothetical protein DWQ19_09780 [Crenarchaeota archaeon]|nr:MAG: hypothetical protein DWQ19_09780 [Thermoproteota archaeon]
MKPLLRWTIGNVHHYGFQILAQSIDKLKKIYKDEFDYLVCHNSLNTEQLAFLEKLSVALYCQDDYQSNLSCPKPTNAGQAGWKIYPPRLRPDGHEIVLDNDVVIKKRIPAIDRFLKSNSIFLITEAKKRCFGAFDSLILPRGYKTKFNTGFFSMPPGYDFETDLENKIKKLNFTEWKDHFDKQGLVAACITSHNYELISLKAIGVHSVNFIPGIYGDHFVGSNSGYARYWRESNKSKIKML